MLNSSSTSRSDAAGSGALRRGELELVYVAPEGLEGSLRGIIADCARRAWWWSTRRTASATGATTSGPPTAASRVSSSSSGDVPVLALTATATRRVAGDIMRQLGMRKPDGFKGSFFRPNLRITAQKKGAGPEHARRHARDRARGTPGESGIVYCLSRKSVESTAEWLREPRRRRRCPTTPASPTPSAPRHQDAFARDEVDVIVATVAFGMGIDKSNVRYVIHRDMPRSIEAWYQEIGRAGRDGLAERLRALLLVGRRDRLRPFPRRDRRRRRCAPRRDARRSSCSAWPTAAAAAIRPGAHFDETIAPCGSRCDTCRGIGVDGSRGAARRGRRGERRARGVRDVADRRRRMRQPARFERLRALRKRLADAENVPAYIVFSDAVLRQMACTSRARVPSCCWSPASDRSSSSATATPFSRRWSAGLSGLLAHDSAHTRF